MVWCRKVWRDVAAFLCETCAEAVEVRRQLLCGRQPGTEPDPAATEALTRRGEPPALERNGRGSRHAGARQGQGQGLSVRMRDKSPTAPRAPGGGAAGGAQPASAAAGGASASGQPGGASRTSTRRKRGRSRPPAAGRAGHGPGAPSGTAAATVPAPRTTPSGETRDGRPEQAAKPAGGTGALGTARRRRRRRPKPGASTGQKGGT
jgi:hypothetical protein